METKERMFYEKEAGEKTFWGTEREISLSENIFSILPKKIGKVIDVGVGDGFLISKISKKNTVFGLDLSKKRLKRTKTNVPNAFLIQGNILRLPFKENSFDTVICSELLEHVKDYKKALSELTRVSNNTIVLTVPNDQKLRKIFCPKCGFKHFLDGHVNSFNKESISKILQSNKKIKLIKIKKFYTIFTYNKLTKRFPKKIRMFLDWAVIKFEKPITFFKPNYLLVLAVKKQ